MIQALFAPGTFCLLAVDEPPAPVEVSITEMFGTGGILGQIIVAVIIALSVAMIALIVEHLLSLRRGVLMPEGLAAEVHGLIAQGRFQQAEQRCAESNSFLGNVLKAGLAEAPLGYAAVEKSMEDASQEQSSRMFRKTEYLSVIGNLAPMLGLMGTVWGMILAFLEFKSESTPQVAQLAPGISQALVTTFLGLAVAVPALACFSIFRNRIDELVAEGCGLSEQVFLDFKKTLARRPAAPPPQTTASSQQQRPQQKQQRAGVPPVAIERKKPGQS